MPGDKNQHKLEQLQTMELDHCTICGGFEGTMPTLCPGRRITTDEAEAIYAGKLDFTHTGVMNGEPAWWAKKDAK